MRTLILFTIILLLTVPAQAQWPTSIRENLPVEVDTAENGRFPATLPLSQDRTLIVYYAGPTLQGNFYQILDRYGNPAFPQPQSLAPAGWDPYTYHAQIAPDGKGGALAAWYQSENGQTIGMHAQRLDSLGNRLWGEAGVHFSNYKPTNGHFGVCTDGLGGCWVAHAHDPSFSSSNVYLQHVSAEGQLPWGMEGVVACSLSLTQRYPVIAPDSAGGCIVAWEDWRPPYTSTGSTFINRFSRQGRPLWGQNGLHVSDGSTTYRTLLADGRGGAILHIGGSYLGNWAHRYDAQGHHLWQRYQVSYNYDAEMIAGEPGFFYTLYANNSSFYAQRIDLQGNRYWPTPGSTQGVRLGQVAGSAAMDHNCVYRYPYLYALCEYTVPPQLLMTYLYAQKLNAQGQLLWGPNGSLMYQDLNDFSGMTSLTGAVDGRGGLVGVWEWKPYSGNRDIWAKRVNADGSLGGPVSAASAADGGEAGFVTPQAVTLSVSPNPFNPSTALSYKLQAASHVSFRVYDTAGREVRTLVNGWREAGWHEVTFDGSDLPSGIYFVRLSAGGNTAVQKLVLLK